MTLQQLKYVVTVSEQKSMNKAAEILYVSQPALSSMIKNLEAEIHTSIFVRTNRGIELTPEGEQFLTYAKQMIDLSELIEDRFINDNIPQKKFSVSMQHYSFAVDAFIKLVQEFGMDEYEFAVHETKTAEVISNVRSTKSEIGILYTNDFNEEALKKLIRENELEYIPLFRCGIYVYLSANHPLSQLEKIDFEQLSRYPCLSFEQGENNSFYLAEEVFSTYDYARIIKADDRATMLNLMVGLDGYTLCSGIISEELNGGGYKAVPLNTEDEMTIGYIKRRKMPLSKLGAKYIEILTRDINV